MIKLFVAIVVLDFLSTALRNGSTPKALGLYGVTDIPDDKVGLCRLNR